ncbi:MAG TPA: hypothetical protein VFP84_09890 [Kofleriaceae bacterium]|nr:hypothetical protein [Kofleriaceae bacterium]
MKKIERKSRVLKLHREIVLHLSPDELRQAAGGSNNTPCFGCHSGSGTTRIETQDNNFLKH